MNKLVFSLLAFVLAVTAAYANPGVEMKASPLFKMSLENSIAKLEGAAEPAAEEMPATEGSDCPSPNRPETEQSSCSPTVCGGSYTCDNSTCNTAITCNGNWTCSGSTCYSTCQSTCSSTCVGGGGNCANYRFKGVHSWECYHYYPSNVWYYRGPPAYLPSGMPHWMFLDDDGTKIKWNDEGNWRDLGIFSVGNGSYNKTIKRTTTSTGYQIKGWIDYWEYYGPWHNHSDERTIGSTSGTNTNNFTHPLVW